MLPTMIVARDVAVSILQAYRNDLELAFRQPCLLMEDVIVTSPAERLWYSVSMTSDPTLLADWVRAQFLRIGDKSRYEFLPPMRE